MTFPFFYGWIVVSIVMIAGFLAAGVSNITMAVVLKPISEDLGWSRTLAAAAITIGAVAGGILSPLFGLLADRLGPRFLLPAGGALVGSLAFGVSLSTEAVLRDLGSRPRAHRVFALRHDRVYGGCQLVLRQTAAGDGPDCYGHAARVRRSVAGPSISHHALALSWRSA